MQERNSQLNPCHFRQRERQREFRESRKGPSPFSDTDIAFVAGAIVFLGAIIAVAGICSGIGI